MIKVVFTLWVSFLLFKSNRFAEGFYRYIFLYKNNYAFICDNILLANIYLVIPRYLNSFEGTKIFQLDRRSERFIYYFKRKRNIAYIIFRREKDRRKKDNYEKKANFNLQKGNYVKKTHFKFKTGNLVKQSKFNFQKGNYVKNGSVNLRIRNDGQKKPINLQKVNYEKKANVRYYRGFTSATP